MTTADSLLIGIASHSSRRSVAQGLAHRVDAQVLNVDDTQDATFEEAVAACAANHLQVLRQLQCLVIDRTWCIVLEDDALPVADFRIHAAAALSHVPSQLAGFYIGIAGAALNLEALQNARTQGVAWATSNHLVSAVAYAIRSDILPAVIGRWNDNCNPETTVEGRITTWSHERRGGSSYPRFYYTVPSLVDHSTADSIIFPGSDAEYRKAWCVGVATDWGTPTVEYDPDM